MKLRITEWIIPHIKVCGDLATRETEYPITWIGLTIDKPYWSAHTTDGHIFEYFSVDNIQMDGEKLKAAFAIEVVP